MRRDAAGFAIVVALNLAMLTASSLEAVCAVERPLPELRQVLAAGPVQERKLAAMEVATARAIPVADKADALVEALAREVAHPTSRNVVTYAPQSEILRAHYSHLAFTKMGAAALPHLARHERGQPLGVRLRLLASRALLGDRTVLPGLVAALEQATDPWDRDYLAWVFNAVPYPPAAPAIRNVLAGGGWALGRSDLVIEGRERRRFIGHEGVFALQRVGVKVERNNGEYYLVDDPAEPRLLFPRPDAAMVPVKVMHQGEELTGARGRALQVNVLLLPGQHVLVPASFLTRVGLSASAEGHAGKVRLSRGAKSCVWSPSPSRFFRGPARIPEYVDPHPTTANGELYVPVVALHPHAVGAVEWEPQARRLWLWN